MKKKTTRASASRSLNDVATDQRTFVTENCFRLITRKQHIFGSYNLIIHLNQFSAIPQRTWITYFKSCHFSFIKVCFTYNKHLQITTDIFLGIPKRVLLFWGSYWQFLNSMKVDEGDIVTIKIKKLVVLKYSVFIHNCTLQTSLQGPWRQLQ